MGEKVSDAFALQNVGDDSGELDKAGYLDGTALFSGHLIQDEIEFVRFETSDEGMSALLAEDIKRLYVIAPDYLATGLGFVAVALATINVVGGFLVTHRMLQMFQRKN